MERKLSARIDIALQFSKGMDRGDSGGLVLFRTAMQCQFSRSTCCNCFICFAKVLPLLVVLSSCSVTWRNASGGKEGVARALELLDHEKVDVVLGPVDSISKYRGLNQ